MEKSRLDAETWLHIQQIAEMKSISEEEAMIAVLNNYAGRYARLVRDSHNAAEKGMQNYNK